MGQQTLSIEDETDLTFIGLVLYFLLFTCNDVIINTKFLIETLYDGNTSGNTEDASPLYLMLSRQ